MIHPFNDFERKMRRAAEALRSIFAEVEQFVAPGVTTEDINQFIKSQLEARGCVSATVGYNPSWGPGYPYPAAVCTALNHIIGHGVPRTDEYLSEGDIISVDIGMYLDGHGADACRTYLVGEVSEEKAALKAASEQLTLDVIAYIAAVDPTLNEIGEFTQKRARELGYFALPNLGGHGIGTVMHDEPFIPCSPTLPQLYGAQRIPDNTFICVEPVIAVAPTSMETADDGWTYYSPTFSSSAQTEHICLKSKSGVEIIF